MYKKYENLTDEEIKEIEDVCKDSTFIPLQIEENDAEPFDEQVIRNNMNDKEFHDRFRAKLDELDSELLEQINKKYDR
jgi:hypothetical protein